MDSTECVLLSHHYKLKKNHKLSHCKLGAIVSVNCLSTPTRNTPLGRAFLCLILPVFQLGDIAGPEQLLREQG